jgi:superfamily II DNA/RNA helicase
LFGLRFLISIIAFLAGDGPIGLIVAPTRELSEQIYQVAKQFAKGFGVKYVIIL